MRFAELVDKRLRPQAWYTLGLSREQRWLLAFGTPLALMLLLHAEVGLDIPHRMRFEMVIGYALIALAFAAFIIPDRWVRWRRTRWVDALELPLDRESYARALDTLSRNTGTGRYGRLRVIVHGKQLKPPDIYGVVAHVEPRADGLVFESFTMQLGFTRQHGVELHRWFVLLVRRVLSTLGREHVIDRVLVEYVDAGH